MVLFKFRIWSGNESGRHLVVSLSRVGLNNILLVMFSACCRSAVSPQLTSDTNTLVCFSAGTHICVGPEVPLWGLSSSRKETINDQIHFDFYRPGSTCSVQHKQPKERLRPGSWQTPPPSPAALTLRQHTQTLISAQIWSVFGSRRTQTACHKLPRLWKWISFPLHVWVQLKPEHVGEWSWKVWR